MLSAREIGECLHIRIEARKGKCSYEELDRGELAFFRVIIYLSLIITGIGTCRFGYFDEFDGGIFVLEAG